MLKGSTGQDLITREGIFYKGHFSLFLWAVQLLYRVAFTIILLIIIGLKIRQEYRDLPNPATDRDTAFLINDVIMALIIVFFTVCYLFSSWIMERGKGAGDRPWTSSVLLILLGIWLCAKVVQFGYELIGDFNRTIRILDVEVQIFILIIILTPMIITRVSSRGKPASGPTVDEPARVAEVPNAPGGGDNARDVTRSSGGS